MASVAVKAADGMVYEPSTGAWRLFAPSMQAFRTVSEIPLNLAPPPSGVRLSPVIKSERSVGFTFKIIRTHLRSSSFNFNEKAFV